jgi:hypothetical protein
MDYNNVINNVIYAVFFCTEKVIKGVVSDSSGPIQVLMLSLKAQSWYTNDFDGKFSIQKTGMF